MLRCIRIVLAGLLILLSIFAGSLLAADQKVVSVVMETAAGPVHIELYPQQAPLGVISMARDGPGSAQSEFFICIGDQPGLDYGASRNPDQLGFAAFGRVVSGMDTVIKIHSSPADAPTDDPYLKGQIIAKPIQILSIKRDAEEVL